MVVGFGVVTTYLTPIVLDPLFNKFTPLPDGPTRSTVLSLAREAGVDVGQVYVMDASRRTTAANAYVTGIGRTKRVVLYDNLLKDFSPGEVRLVVAHELGHVHYRDVPHGLLYLRSSPRSGCSPPPGWGSGSRRATRSGTAAAVPAVVLAVGLMAPAITTISNQLSRGVESRADQFSLELAGEPETFIGFQKRIAVTNVSDPDPPRLRSGSCSARTRRTIERIGLAPSASSASASGRRGPAAATSGRFLIPSVVRHLDQLSSMASISSRKKRGERFMRETTTPGTSPSSTSWSTRANVIENS